MNEIQFVGKMNLQPFISLRKEEELRIKEVRAQQKKAKFTPTVINIELTYERDFQEDY